MKFSQLKGSIGAGYSELFYNTVYGPFKVLANGDLKYKFPKEEKVIQLSSRQASHTLFLTQNHSIYSIGSDHYQQLGHYEVDDEKVAKNDEFKPRKIIFFERLKKQGVRVLHVICGYDSSYAVVTDHSKKYIYAWGDNNFGQCGVGHFNKINKPEIMIFPSKHQVFSSITTGQDHVHVLFKDETVFSVGYNENGCLGVGDEKGRDKLVEIEYFSKNNIKIIKASGGWSNFSIFLSKDSRVFGTGSTSSFGIKVESSITMEKSLPLEIIKLRDKKIVEIETTSNQGLFFAKNGDIFLSENNTIYNITYLKVLESVINVLYPQEICVMKGGESCLILADKSGNIYKGGILKDKCKVTKIVSPKIFVTHDDDLIKFGKSILEKKKYYNVKVFTISRL